MYQTPEEHREDIIKTVSDLFRAKYDKGQKEHGGQLWEKPQMPELVNETLDYLSYVFTLRTQLAAAKGYLHAALIDNDWDKIHSALNILETGNTRGAALND